MSTDRRTYIRLHDGMPEHPKVVGLSDSAFRAYVELLCWCSRGLTDGQVPAAAARRVARPKVIAELVAAGLVDEAEIGYRLHDYLLHQRSRAQVESAVEQRRAAGSAGGQAKAQRQTKRKGGDTTSETRSDSLGDSLPLPLDESPSEPSSETASKALPETETENRETSPPPPSVVPPTPRRASQVPADFTVTDGMRKWAMAEVPRVDVDAQTAQFVDHFRASGKPHKDWVAAWRNWMRRAAEFGHVRPLSPVADRMAVGYGDADRTAPARTLTPEEWAREGRTASGGTR